MIFKWLSKSLMDQRKNRWVKTPKAMLSLKRMGITQIVMIIFCVVHLRDIMTVFKNKNIKHESY